ncbi:MAG: RNA methyltransferase [Bacilli bacterium]|jgi:TrmH family RNA methyltransferase|uniref:TrmH family RNA methyltransferase n=1 Tax=Ureibacillus suwonensis TaxID=313007 RepID=A0ABW0RFM0_9BACL|nr:RNA methyltransferase [Bacilli bacterium]
MKRIESKQNALVKHWKKLVSAKKERDKTGEYIVEGFHLTEEALKNKDQVIHIIKREDVEIPREWSLDDVYLVEVTDSVAKEIAETETSQGIFAHCKQREISGSEQAKWSKLLLVDSVQDPGNIGTMIRTADACGIDAVILGKGCADLYNPKTLRSAQGSHFHLPVIRGNLAEWIEKLKERHIPVFGTALENAVDYRKLDKTESFALLVGNEGSGVHQALLEKTDQNVVIPIFGQAESLNVAVATGILLYKFME